MLEWMGGYRDEPLHLDWEAKRPDSELGNGYRTKTIPSQFIVS